MDIKNDLAQSPAFWAVLGVALPILSVLAALYLYQKLPKRLRDAFPSRAGAIKWLKSNYVPTILISTASLAILALSLYLFDIARAVHNMVGLLLGQTRDIREGNARLSDSSDTLRNLAQGSALLLGVLAAAATIFFSVIRVWINDRNIRATEDGLITDRINKAVEGLGAEKTVSRQRRNSGGVLVYKKDDDGEPLYDEPIYESITEPNLEVRIGAIFALERIAQDSERDHIQIMEILCAYIRQNAGRENVSMPPKDASSGHWKAWGWEVRTPPRLDVDMAHKVISQRSEARKAHEEKQNWRLNLQRADLRGLILEDLNLHRADLRNAKLQGADFRRAQLQGADLDRAGLQGATLWGAELQGADLWGAKLQGANLEFAGLQGADLEFAELQGADLSNAKLQGVYLRGAKLHGAYLEDAEFDATTDLSKAYLRGALLRSVDFTDLPQITPHLKEAFFDGSVTLPGGITSDMDGWPADRPRESLDDDYGDESSPLYEAWRAWQREHHPDTLPDHLR